MAKAKKRPAEAWTYVLKADRTLPLDQQSRFTLRPMVYAERAMVQDDFLRSETRPDGTRVDISRVYRNAGEIALEYIVSIENFPAGAAQAWPATRAERERYLEMLDDEQVLELGNETWIRSSMGIDGDAIKNVSTPEPTLRSGDTSGASTSTIAPPAPSSPP